MPLEERLPIEDLDFGMVLLDPLLIILRYWSGDITQDDGKQDISIEQRMMLLDESDRVLLCTGRKIAKTLSLERDVVQIGMTHRQRGTLDEALFFTPAQAHMNPVRDRIYSKIQREPLFMEMIERSPSSGHPIMSKGDGVLQFKTGLKWHFRIEGTCLAPETIIMDADTGAIYSIEDMYYGCLPDNIHTLDQDRMAVVGTGDYTVKYNGRRQLYKMTLRDGSEIRATANHMFLTDTGWKRLDEIAYSDFVAVPSHVKVHSDRSALTYREARLLGYFIGDGGVTHGGPRFTNFDDGIVQDFVACCESLGVGVNNPKPGYYTVSNGNAGGRWSPNAVTEFLRKHDVWDRYAHEKHVPDAVFCSDDETIAQFLGALWSCDGTAFVSPNGSSYVEYYSNSERLIRGVATLLLRLGIRGRIAKREIAGEERQYRGRRFTVRHDMWIWKSGAVSDVLAFAEKVECHGYKQEQVLQAAHNVAAKPMAFKSDGIPTTIIRRIIAEEWDGSLNGLQREVGCAVGNKTYKTHSPYKVERLNEVLGSDELAAYIDGDVSWVEIVDIEEDGVDDTYDLHVNGTNTFIANDIFVHNSGSDVNMVGLRAIHIIGDECAFSNDACHKSRVNTALPGCHWKYCGVPNGVRGTPFWRLDQTQEGDHWSRHKYPQFINPLYSSASSREILIRDHGGAHTHSYVTQVLGQWGDAVMSSFPPGTIATYNDRPYFVYEWGGEMGKEKTRRTEMLEYVYDRIGPARNARCIIGWDYGVSPDPAAISLFFEEEPQHWYLRVMIIMRQVTSPHQISFINQIADYFNLAFVCTDEAIMIQQLESFQRWELFDEEKQTGNIEWANLNGRIDLLDSKGNVVMDELGTPVKEYRKKWATDELRASMVHANENLEYPYLVFLPEEDDYLIDELVGTTERRTTGGYVQYLTAKRTEGSQSPDDHRTDSLRYFMLAAYALLGARARDVRPPYSEYKAVLGWKGATSTGWVAPWES